MWNPDPEIIKKILNEPLNVFINAAINDRQLAAKLLLSDPSLIEQRTEYLQSTALAEVIVDNHSLAAAFLLERGAEIDPRDFGNRTPLLCCADFGNIECTKVLLEWGARTDVMDDWGWTPLRTAIVEGHVEIVDMLLTAGADASYKRADSTPILDLVRTSEHPGVVDVFRKNGYNM